MPAEQTRADVYLAELSRIYNAPGSPDVLTKRLASWLGNADRSVLLFALVVELRTLNANIAELSKRSGDGL